jgi:hypothetical protein
MRTGGRTGREACEKTLKFGKCRGLISPTEESERQSGGRKGREARTHVLRRNPLPVEENPKVVPFTRRANPPSEERLDCSSYPLLVTAVEVERAVTSIVLLEEGGELIGRERGVASLFVVAMHAEAAEGGLERLGGGGEMVGRGEKTPFRLKVK